MNPREDGYISGNSSEDWISDISADSEGKILFNASENTSEEQRTGYIELVYSFGEDQKVSTRVNLSQAAGDYADYELVATFASGAYYGNRYSELPDQMN